jgi:hypothetical protein
MAKERITARAKGGAGKGIRQRSEVETEKLAIHNQRLPKAHVPTDIAQCHLKISRQRTALSLRRSHVQHAHTLVAHVTFSGSTTSIFRDGAYVG